MTEVDLEQWLRQCAGKIEFPLKRKKMKRRNCDVTLAVEIYRTRFAEIFYVEFAIYSDELPRPGPYESKSVPIYDWRLNNPTFGRADGLCPDLPIKNDDVAALALAKEQIVVQGKRIFGAVHSLETLARGLRQQSRIDPSRTGNGPVDAIIADRIEAFLTRNGQAIA